MQAPLDDFLAHDLDESSRQQLIDVMDSLTTGVRYMTFNVHNVLIDADGDRVVVEDELDASRQTTLSREEFRHILKGFGQEF